MGNRGHAGITAQSSVNSVSVTMSHQEDRVAIRGLGARTCGTNLQALFWENPQDAPLVAYEFRIVLPNGVASLWHSLAVDELPCRDWDTHSVLIHHNLDDPWDLKMELRGVNHVHHGDPQMSIHLAATYEVEYTKSMWQSQDPRGGRPRFAIGLEDESGQVTGAMRDMSAGMLGLTITEDQSLEEAHSKATRRGARHRRQGGDWRVPSAKARRQSFDRVRPSSLPSTSYSPEDLLGGMLESRDWDLRVHLENSGEVWFVVHEDRTWERGYELQHSPLREVPKVASASDG